MAVINHNFDRAARSQVMSGLVQHAFWVGCVVNETERIDQIVWFDGHQLRKLFGASPIELHAIGEAVHLHPLARNF